MNPWYKQAQVLFTQFLRVRSTPFLAEDFVKFAAGKIDPPPDPRSWGGTIRQAVIARKIVKVGYGLAITSNRSPKCLWRRTAK